MRGVVTPQSIQVAGYQVLPVGPLHLDCDGRAVGKSGPMDLGERGRGDRLRIERCEELYKGFAELTLDDEPNVVEGNLRAVLLQTGKGVDTRLW